MFQAAAFRFFARGSLGFIFKIVLSTLVALGGFAHEAQAQTTFTLDRAQLSGAPDDGFMVFRPYMAEKSRFYFNSGLGFSLNPLRDSSVTEDAATRRQMENPIQGQFLLYPSVGMELFGRFGVNLSMPFVIGQLTGEDPRAFGIGSGGLEGMKAAVGDLRVDFRGVGYISRDKKTRIGGVFAFTAPTSGGNNFGGDAKGTAELFINAEHHFRSFFITGHIGPHFRPQTSIGGANADLRVGSELRYALGFFFPMRGERMRLGAELWGSTGIQGATNTQPSTFFLGRNTTLEWLAQARFKLGREKNYFLNAGGGTRLTNGYGSADVRLLGSFGGYFPFQKTDPEKPSKSEAFDPQAEHYNDDSDGDGIPDGIDACPDEPEDGLAPDPDDGCPAPPDSDGDGIFDTDDQCVDEPEDFDGIEDQDGCPETDADNDQVPDNQDACPLVPGPAGTNAPGCPTLTKINEAGGVDLLEPIQFERGRERILEASYPILDEIYALMMARPDLRLAVHGHSDNVGSDLYNLDLSQKRAAEVAVYLVQKGIDPKRLEAQGFGSEKPIADNRTQAGRAKNRRVEFVAIMSDEASE